MDIIAGYLSIALSFVLLATMFLWFFIKGNASIYLKLIIIPVVIWYTLALYYAPDNLMGWPTPEGPPSVARVIYGIVQKPGFEREGVIYLWMISLDKEDDFRKGLSSMINPENVFDYNAKNVPRAYKLPYNEKLDRQLAKGKDARMNDLGSVMIFKRKGKGKLKKRKGYGEEYKDDTKIEIHNLRGTMKKIKTKSERLKETNIEIDKLIEAGGS